MSRGQLMTAANLCRVAVVYITVGYGSSEIDLAYTTVGYASSETDLGYTAVG